MAFGQRFREVVKHYRYTQDEFAGILGTSKANLFNYFSDKTKPNVEMMAKLKEAHPDLNMDWLITGVGELSLKDTSSDYVKADTALDKLAENSFPYGFEALLKEKDKRIATLEELVEMLREKIKRLEENI